MLEEGWCYFDDRRPDQKPLKTVVEKEVQWLGERKARNILDTGAEAVFTGNVGCLIQVGRYLRKHGKDLWVAHPVDALWASYNK